LSKSYQRQRWLVRHYQSARYPNIHLHNRIEPGVTCNSVSRPMHISFPLLIRIPVDVLN